MTPSPTVRDHTQLRVLILDDDADMRALLTNIILPLEHQVIPVSSAEEALAQLPFFTFDVALLDHNLPGMEGLVFGDYLQRNNPTMNIALITADPDPSLERQTREHGILLIRKPFRVDHILDLLDRATTRIQDDTRRSQESQKPNFTPRLNPEQPSPLSRFGLTTAPQRLEDAIIATIKETLYTMRSSQVLDHEVRNACYCALVTALSLNVKLPSLNDGASPYEAYDALMTSHGLRREFSNQNTQTPNSENPPNV